ncbi:MAG: YegS/Rv2252/BmrU family lipid kinase [Terrimicrobiaceae bacterium]|nr:YegS/Rv2252/BmrU family lipid kinase [Terrimicrobiaceae bacterium]
MDASDPPRRAWLVINPAAGSVTSDEQLEARICGRLRAAGWQIDVRRTTGEGSAGKIAEQAIRENLDTLVVAGGDGTVGLVASVVAETSVTLGILPMGTFNNVARSIGIPNDLDAALEILIHGRRIRIDACEAGGRRPFFEAAGVGLDATLFPLGEAVKDGQWTRWADIALQTIDYPIQHFHLTLKGTPLKSGWARFEGTRILRRNALLVVIANGPYYGGGFTVAPGARLNDGLLTIGIYRNFSKIELLRHFFSIRRGKLRRSPKVETYRAREIVVRSSSPVSVHADGQPAGTTPVVIRCVPGALRVIAPSPETSEVEKRAAGHEAEEALRRSFAEVRDRATAAETLEKIERSAADIHEDDLDGEDSPAAAGSAIRAATDSVPPEEKPAAALAETAVQAAAADDPEIVDAAIENVAREPTHPAVERGRRLLREELLHRLTPFDRADAAVFLAINHFPHPPAANTAFSKLSRLMTGGHAWLIPLAIGMLVSPANRWERFRRVVPAMYLATFLIEVPVKRYFRRKRPFISIVRAVVVGKKPGSYSFPSGHSAAAFAGATLLAREFPKARPWFFAMAGLVAFSRVYLGAHYPGDVATGSLLGSFLARSFQKLFNRQTPQ